MSFFQKSDKLTEVLSQLAEKGYLSKDIFDTMRFGHLAPDEKFINVYCFSVARSFLYTGISQWEKMVDALKKWKQERDAEVKEKPSEDPQNAEIMPFLEGNYNPVTVDDIIRRWEGCPKDCPEKHLHYLGYNVTEEPNSKSNVTWVLNHGWRFNRSLMHWSHYFDPAHVSALNSSFGINGRTFEALTGTLKSLGKREFEIAAGSEKKEGWHLQKPLAKD